MYKTHHAVRYFRKGCSNRNKVIDHLKEEIGTVGKGFSTYDPYFKTFLKCKNVKELSQGMLTDLVGIIYIHGKGEVTIHFKSDDEYKRIANFIGNKKYIFFVVENGVSQDCRKTPPFFTGRVEHK